MEKVIVAFRSRSDTLGFAEFLKRNGIACRIVNTPKEAQVGCGLSAEVLKVNLSLVRVAVKRFSAKSFAGIFAVYFDRGRIRIKAV